MDMISVKNLNYDKILKNINITIKEGDFISIIGPNSSGKTTLLKTIAGLIKTKKNISFNHIYIETIKNNEYLKEIGISFNEYNKYLFEDVFHELAFPLENLNISKVEQQKRILELTDFLNISYLLDKKCCDLKEEEKQLVSIAKSLIHKPKIIILDNPFSMLSNKIKNNIINKLLELNKKENLTIILSSNNLEDIVYSKYTYVLDNGEIVIEGNTKSILKEDIILKKIGLDLPFSVKLSLMLKFYEIYDCLELDYNEVINKLWS